MHAGNSGDLLGVIIGGSACNSIGKHNSGTMLPHATCFLATSYLGCAASYIPPSVAEPRIFLGVRRGGSSIGVLPLRGKRSACRDDGTSATEGAS